MDARPARRIERNMVAKRGRIFKAAAELFGEHGFEAVTTQAISESADVASGTVFRYAASKADLLLAVYNVEFREAIRAGRERAASVGDVAESVFAFVLPVLQGSQKNPENAIQYQRELLFGRADTPHRSEGLALVSELEEGVAALLAPQVDPGDPDAAGRAQRAGRLVFAALHLALAQPSTGAHADKSPAQELREQVSLVVRGFQATDQPSVPSRTRA